MTTGVPLAPRDRGDTVTANDFRRMKREGRKIAVLTCYDFLFARLVSEAGIDAVLVGDSVGQLLLGYDSTLPVTMDDMIHHTAAVRRGLAGPMLIFDLPFMSYQTSTEDTLRNAGRAMKETGCEAVKLEGGDAAAVSRVRALASAGIPVMGHLGLTPQAVHRIGGYRVTAREEDEARTLAEQARALEDAGCFGIVLELVPAPLAARVSASLDIPTIGIGAGPDCDGQVLVLHDMLGLNQGFEPRFLRRFAELGAEALEAMKAYAEAVREGSYPAESESYEG
jgi:3-methyl-2-oxobutanoate hydroxymethyltransferase